MSGAMRVAMIVKSMACVAAVDVRLSVMEDRHLHRCRINRIGRLGDMR